MQKYLKEFLISRATSGEISQQDDAKYDKVFFDIELLITELQITNFFDVAITKIFFH